MLLSAFNDLASHQVFNNWTITLNLGDLSTKHKNTQRLKINHCKERICWFFQIEPGLHTALVEIRLATRSGGHELRPALQPPAQGAEADGLGVLAETRLQTHQGQHDHHEQPELCRHPLSIPRPQPTIL